MSTRITGLLMVACVLATPALAQDARESQVMTAVRNALAPALPFPVSDEDGALPANGNTEALWMVRPTQPGELTIEVLANPLNDINQVRAARAMKQIESNIEAAQRKATAQYDRALAEAKRSGRSQEVDGISLSDEGVAGAKIDADSHVEIEVAFNKDAYQFDVKSSVRPALSTLVPIPGAIAVIAVPSNSYLDDQQGGERYTEAQTQVFLGRIAPPEIRKRTETSYEVIAEPSSADGAAGIHSLVLRLRGNEVLIAELLRKTNWNLLLELLK